MDNVRLIDANALMKSIGKIPQLRGITYGRMKKAVEETPTIDAVPVVRCKDCKEYIYPAGVCKYWNRPVRCDGYCNYGAKMGDQADAD